MPTSIETEYANTDFDLKSQAAFDTLHSELQQSCCVLSYVIGADEKWHAIVESASTSSSAATNIIEIIEALKGLSSAAKAELNACSLREFNIGFHCGDSWAYAHALPADVVRAVADAGCSIAVTLYPMRNADGTPKE